MIYSIDTIIYKRVEINIEVYNLIFYLIKNFDNEIIINLNIILQLSI